MGVNAREIGIGAPTVRQSYRPSVPSVPSGTCRPAKKVPVPGPSSQISTIASSYVARDLSAVTARSPSSQAASR
jgi:hypothetical protein